MKKSSMLIRNYFNLRTVLKTILLCITGYFLLSDPEAVAEGVKKGLNIIGNELIPALFPFMILAKYISLCNISLSIARISDKFFGKFFGINGNGAVAFVLGVLGGYPVGAKATADLYNDKKITRNEAERLFYWCINPSPSFTITTIGAFMYGSISTGVIIYISCIAAALTVGISSRFLQDKDQGSVTLPTPESSVNSKNNFITAVTDSTESMLNICGWILTFSALCAVVDMLPLSDTVTTFIKAVSEVTLGCKTVVSQGLSLPVTSALVGFGGFAVIFQAGAFGDKCGIRMSHFICSRIITAALSGIYTSVLIRFVPMDSPVSTTLGGAHSFLKLYDNVPVTIILLFMCAVLILEVDKRKKIC